MREGAADGKIVLAVQGGNPMIAKVMAARPIRSGGFSLLSRAKKLSPGRMPKAEAEPGLTRSNIVDGVMNGKGFQFSSSVLNALENSLSPERLATYVSAAGTDRERAMRLYTWNTAISSAFYGPLQGLEVALRNAMTRELTATYGVAWYDNAACGLDAGTLNRIAAAKDELRRDGYPIDPPHLVAALSFGFWVALLGAGGRSAALGRPKQNYEMTLWRPCLHRAFPHARINRRQAHRPLDYLRTLRNRIAHHEPIFTRHLAADYASILGVTAWIDPATRDWIDHHSRVGELLTQPRDRPDIQF